MPPSCCCPPPHLPLFSFSLSSVFGFAGPFSSFRHHLAHHSGRPRRPGLALAGCQRRNKWWPRRQSTPGHKGPGGARTAGLGRPHTAGRGASIFKTEQILFFFFFKARGLRKWRRVLEMRCSDPDRGYRLFIIFSHFIVPIKGGRTPPASFLLKGTEAQRGWVLCPTLHSEQQRQLL